MNQMMPVMSRNSVSMPSSGVEMTGLPPSRYSSTLEGTTYRMALLGIEGRRQTSDATMKSAISPTGRRPVNVKRSPRPLAALIPARVVIKSPSPTTTTLNLAYLVMSLASSRASSTKPLWQYSHPDEQRDLVVGDGNLRAHGGAHRRVQLSPSHARRNERNHPFRPYSHTGHVAAQRPIRDHDVIS